MVEDTQPHQPTTTVRRGFITSSDVAERAGVSRSAVSRAFTPGASVSPDVRRKVLAAADELGYRVNRLARGLISARSNLVGLVCADLETPFSSALLLRTTAALAARGLHALVFAFGRDAADAREAFLRILEFRVEAIVVMSGEPPAAIVGDCLANGVKLVMVDHAGIDDDVFNVNSDNYGGGALAAGRFADAGLQRLAVIGGIDASAAQQRRVAGFVERAAVLGRSVRVIEAAASGYEGGAAGAAALFSAPSETFPDGVFCANDVIAAGFMDAARDGFGLTIPDDVSVIGFDDNPHADWAAYRLTTLRQCTQDIARAIVQAIRDVGQTSALVTTGVGLVERDSVRR